MLKWKKINPPNRVLPIKITEEEFKFIYFSLLSDKQLSREYFLMVLNSFYTYLEELFWAGDYSKNLFLLSLAQLLDAKPQKSLSKINRFKVYLKQNCLSFVDILNLLTIEHLSVFKNKLKKASFRKIELTFLNSIKLLLVNKIRSSIRENIFYIKRTQSDALDEFGTIDIYSNLSFRTLILDDLSQYNYDLIHFELTTVERAELFKLKRQNLYRQEKEKWHYLRHKQ